MFCDTLKQNKKCAHNRCKIVATLVACALLCQFNFFKTFFIGFLTYFFISTVQLQYLELGLAGIRTPVVSVDAWYSLASSLNWSWTSSVAFSLCQFQSLLKNNQFYHKGYVVHIFDNFLSPPF